MDKNKPCWSLRGCDEELVSRCPHATSSTDGLCPAQCVYSRCSSQNHRQLYGLALLDAAADRSAAVKELCWYCEYFVKNAPRL
ncbi:MAG: hypothetical protein FWH40_10210 [Coriobacteriia bacterium]|nr:hypothetical protein [Coriobacteriia bacterium]MCL2137868.1 hypothetical protein [Coriobacteriia bacterium]